MPELLLDKSVTLESYFTTILRQTVVRRHVLSRESLAFSQWFNNGLNIFYFDWKLVLVNKTTLILIKIYDSFIRQKI